MEIVGIIIGALAVIAAPLIVYYLRKREAERQRQHRQREQTARSNAREMEELRKRQAEQKREREAQLKKQAQRRDEIQRTHLDIIVKTIEVLIIGQPGVGKTQLIWTAQGRSDAPQATVSKTLEEFPRATVVNGIKYLFNYTIPDIGGDVTFMGDVHRELTTRRPSAIILVVDHNSALNKQMDVQRVEEHMRTVYSLLGPLSDDLKGKCRYVLFLINKQDLWDHSYSEQEMRSHFSGHVGKFEQIGLNVIVHCISAKTGANMSQALSNLEKQLLKQGQ